MKIVTTIELFGEESRELDNNYYMMLKIWLHRLNIYASECDIELLYVNENQGHKSNVLFYNDFKKFLSKYPNLKINILKVEQPDFDYTPRGRRRSLKHQQFFNNKIAILSQKPPFIWMDIDLFLFRPLKEFYQHLGEHPFVGTGHGSHTRGEKEKVQAGLYILNKQNYIDIEVGLEECRREAGDQAQHVCHDQGIINGFFRKTGKNPFVFEGHEYWNWHGMRCDFHKDGNEEFVRCTDIGGDEVFGCHFWGLQKPWRYPRTVPFWEDCVKRIV
tara:strand:+ start:4566 stop:5384 length:819 start_codon:yes stop_codon:yes gene_type:complete